MRCPPSHYQKSHRACRYINNSEDGPIKSPESIRLELNELTDWFYANKLSLDVNITKYSIFTPNRNISDHQSETTKLIDTPNFT